MGRTTFLLYCLLQLFAFLFFRFLKIFFFEFKIPKFFFDFIKIQLFSFSTYHYCREKPTKLCSLTAVVCDPFAHLPAVPLQRLDQLGVPRMRANCWPNWTLTAQLPWRVRPPQCQWECFVRRKRFWPAQGGNVPSGTLILLFKFFF